jgi:hypothetical protein
MTFMFAQSHCRSAFRERDASLIEFTKDREVNCPREVDVALADGKRGTL